MATSIQKVSASQVAKLSSLIGGLTSDSIVTTTKSRKRANPGEPIELTSFTVTEGSWIISGQAAFSVEGSTDDQIEYKLSLVYTSGGKNVGGRHSYMRMMGGEFGSPIVIDAVIFDKLTTVTLLYLTQSFKAPWADPHSDTYGPSTSVRDQILIGHKTSSLLVY